MSNLNKTVKGLSSQTLVTIIMGTLELIVFATMSRLLTKTEFGIYAILQSMIMIFKSLSEAGLGSSIIQKKEPTQSFINTAFSLSIGFGFLFTSLAICLSNPISDFYNDDQLIIPFCLIAVSLIPYSLNSIFRGLMFKKLNFLKYGIFQVLAYIISNTIGVYMAYNGYGVYSLVLSNMFNIVFQTVMLYIKSDHKPKIEFVKKDAIMILSFGGWLTITRLFSQLYSEMDKLIIGKLLSVDILGLFYRVKGFIDAIDSQIGGIFDVTLFPILSDIQDNNDSLKRAYLKSTYFSGIFFSFLFLMFFFNADFIIRVFLGEKWINQVALFRMLSFSMFTYFLSRLNDCFIRSLALLKFAFILRIISIGVLFASILSLIKFNTMGVAIAICLTDILISLIKTIYICRIIRLPINVLLNSICVSLRYSIPIVITGCLSFVFVKSSIYVEILFVVIFILLTTVIFLLFPNFVGYQYKMVVYLPIKEKAIKFIKDIKI